MKLFYSIFIFVLLSNITTYGQNNEINDALDTINFILKDSPMKMTFDGVEYISITNSYHIETQRVEEFSFSLTQIEEVRFEKEIGYHVLKLICLLAEKPCFSDKNTTNSVRYVPLTPHSDNERIAIELMFIKSKL